MEINLQKSTDIELAKACVLLQAELEHAHNKYVAVVNEINRRSEHLDEQVLNKV
jgi:hypothetical protein